MLSVFTDWQHFQVREGVEVLACHNAVSPAGRAPLHVCQGQHLVVSQGPQGPAGTLRHLYRSHIVYKIAVYLVE
jgi:hypothetical protein